MAPMQLAARCLLAIHPPLWAPVAVGQGHADCAESGFCLRWWLSDLALLGRLLPSVCRLLSVMLCVHVA